MIRAIFLAGMGLASLAGCATAPHETLVYHSGNAPVVGVTAAPPATSQTLSTGLNATTTDRVVGTPAPRGWR